MSRKFDIVVTIRSCYNFSGMNCLFRATSFDIMEDRDIPHCTKAVGDISYQRRVYAENVGAITKSCPFYDCSMEENES